MSTDRLAEEIARQTRALSELPHLSSV